MVGGFRVQAVRRAVRRPAITRCIEVWHTFGERLACDLHKLWGDRVLRARNPDGQDHGFKLKHQQNMLVLTSGGCHGDARTMER